eukprot:COSAG01_NODE_10452_length_2162_cov_1.245759_3_plen_67_part_00
MWNRREISVGFDDDQSHDLRPHPYVPDCLCAQHHHGRLLALGARLSKQALTHSMTKELDELRWVAN